MHTVEKNTELNPGSKSRPFQPVCQESVRGMLRGAALQSPGDQTLDRHPQLRAASSVYNSPTNVIFYMCHYVNKVRQCASSHNLFAPQFSPVCSTVILCQATKVPEFHYCRRLCD